MGNLPVCVGRSSKNADKESDRIPRRQPDDIVDSAASVATVDSYEARMRIDDDVLIERYSRRMKDDGHRRYSPATSRRRSSGPRVTFRAGSFDSLASTESERLDFVMSLIDSLQETFLDDDPATAAGQQLLVAVQVNEPGGVDDVNDRGGNIDKLAAEQQSKALSPSLAPLTESSAPSSSDWSRVTASKTRRSSLGNKPESTSNYTEQPPPINSKFRPTNGAKVLLPESPGQT